MIERTFFESIQTLKKIKTKTFLGGLNSNVSTTTTTFLQGQTDLGIINDFGFSGYHLHSKCLGVFTIAYLLLPPTRKKSRISL